MNAHATIGHNNPPSPLEDALAPFGDIIAEAENWLDGAAVETEGQMQAVDAILRGVKEAEKSVKAGEAERAKPLHDAWKAEKALWKPTLDDLDRIKRGLIAALDGFKRRKAAEIAEQQRKAQAEAEAKARAAHEARMAANAADIEAQRAADAATREAEAAAAAAKATAKQAVKGMRTVHRWEIENMGAAVNWIARNDKAAMTAFAEDYVRRNFRAAPIDGVRTWDEKEAF